eukprot:scpid56768/ scgid25558/ Leucine-rich repeat-containing protein 51; Protein LRTOMT1
MSLPAASAKRSTGKREAGASRTCTATQRRLAPLDMTYREIQRLELAIDILPRGEIPRSVVATMNFPDVTDVMGKNQDGAGADSLTTHVIRRPNRQQRRKRPKYEDDSSDSDTEVVLAEREVRRYKSDVLKLANNHIQKMTTFQFFIEAVVVEPLMITWLDLSFNSITKIPSYISLMKHLTIFYLHSNKVRNVRGLAHLQFCDKLLRFTMHCNPVCEKPLYRYKAIALLPRTVTSLDFSAVTKSEKAAAHTWYETDGKQYFSSPELTKQLLHEHDERGVSGMATTTADDSDEDFELDFAN